MKIKNSFAISLFCLSILAYPVITCTPVNATVAGSYQGGKVVIDAQNPGTGNSEAISGDVAPNSSTQQSSAVTTPDAPADPPAVPQAPVYTDGTVRDQRGCITANYTPDGGGIMTERLVNNRGRQIALCTKTSTEAPVTPVNEEGDNGPSEEALIAQQAAHEYTSMSLPTPVLKANDGKEAHPGYMNLYYGYNTHFYTEKTSASTQRKEATLLGNAVIIEAIPVGYTYIYGDKLPIKAFALMVAFLSLGGEIREPAPAQTMTNPALSDT